MSWTLRVCGCVAVTTQPTAVCSQVVPATKTTNRPAEPLPETKELRATKQLIAQHCPQPGSTPQHLSQAPRPCPAAEGTLIQPHFIFQWEDWVWLRGLTEALTIWDKRSGTEIPHGWVWTTAGLPMSIFSLIMSPPTKDTAFSKGQNLHQPCHLTHQDTLCSTKKMGEDKEEFRHSLHNTRMTNTWKNVWECGDW